jgi:two-component system chemotaxis response regulator CheY
MHKILIVDDSATMRRLILRVLRQADFQVDTVLEASNGQEGLQRLVSDPDVQLILSDIHMPEMNGVDFLKAVRTKHAKHALPMVMISAEGHESFVQAALESGANACVRKPFTAESIRQALEEVLK